MPVLLFAVYCVHTAFCIGFTFHQRTLSRRDPVALLARPFAIAIAWALWVALTVWVFNIPIDPQTKF